MILGFAWDAFFDAIYGDPANFWFSWEVHEKQLLTLFTMILLIFLNICICLEAAFVVKTRYLFYFFYIFKKQFLSLFFRRYWDAFGKQFLTLFTVIPFIFLILGRAGEAAFVAIYGDPANFCFS